jgi:CRISPR-associated protein Cmr2
VSSDYLLLVTIGPIQEFIAQARRTRDLWFGSHLLSELSRAAAKSLADRGATLIFPCLDEGDAELVKCDTPTRPGSGEPPLSIVNKILAKLPPALDPAELARGARTAVVERWAEISEGVRRRAGKLLADNIGEVWNEQIGEAIEFYAAWEMLADDYKSARVRVERALTGRKNLRDFPVWTQDRVGAPKSSLDGARVSVLASDRSDPNFARLRIASGEQLDAVGLVKRAGFDPEQFVPIINIAAAPWLSQASALTPDEFGALGAACEKLGLGRIVRDLPMVRYFRHDASVFYPSRWPSLFDELGCRDANKARDWGERNVAKPILAKLSQGVGAPSPYVACLVADGDYMGATIDALSDPEKHRAFSRALAAFPERARTIVESERHLGSLVYAGADDVLAFLPVATALLWRKSSRAPSETS